MLNVYTMSTGREGTRERILSAARRLLEERGYQGVGVDQIARAAGVSRQAVYVHHFASKADLLLALLDHVDEEEHVAALFVPVQEARSGAEMLTRLVRAMTELWSRVFDLARVLDAARATDPAAEIAWQNRVRMRREGFTRALTWLKRERSLAAGWTVPTGADFLLTLLSHQTYASLVSQCGWSKRAFEVRMTKLVTGVLVR